MIGNAVHPTGRTVRRRLTLVNSLVTVTSEASGEADEDTPGRRLQLYIAARWTRPKGGMKGLAGVVGTTTETMYAWFRGDQEPNMGHLRAVADALGVRRAVLVAVMDGDPLPGEGLPVRVEARLRYLERELEYLRAQQVDGASPGRSAPHETTG